MSIDFTYFEALQKRACQELEAGTHVNVALTGEKSQFIRFNGARIRQIGTVEDASLELSLFLETPRGIRKGSSSFSLTGMSGVDFQRVDQTLASLRTEVPLLPVDPYAKLPENSGSSRQEKKGSLLPTDQAAETILRTIQGLDLVGIYSAGTSFRAMANSAGLSHWFSTENFSLDYSLYTPNQKAIKGTFAGNHWSDERFAAEIGSAKRQLPLLERPPRKIARGQYRTYLAPAAVQDLLSMFSWEGISEAAIRQGSSPFQKLRSGERTFSAKLNVQENFAQNEIPRFNDQGELAPEVFSLIENGQLKNTLISSRSSKEYGLTANGANESEMMRAVWVSPGNLKEAEILKQLGTGLYLSNLHYLNWSDQTAGRITGMTRYACFWVENGELVSPIENMRWDESLFSLFGENLIDFTDSLTFIPEVMTYEARQLGGAWVPGALISSVNFTI